jgi:hypothetical protein
MTQENLVIGEHTPFIRGVEVAVLSGSSVDQCLSILGASPPFRDQIEANQLTLGDTIDAKRIASIFSGAGYLALEVGKREPTTDLVVCSRTGAIALRTNGGNTASEAIRQLQLLDGGNTALILSTHQARAGNKKQK